MEKLVGYQFVPFSLLLPERRVIHERRLAQQRKGKGIGGSRIVRSGSVETLDSDVTGSTLSENRGVGVGVGSILTGSGSKAGKEVGVTIGEMTVSLSDPKLGERRE